MLNTLIKIFSKPSATELAYRELEDAQRHLLEFQKQRDYYAKLSEFSEVRIASLKRRLAQEKSEHAQTTKSI
jgi:hypothetical protein